MLFKKKEVNHYEDACKDVKVALKRGNIEEAKSIANDIMCGNLYRFVIKNTGAIHEIYDCIMKYEKEAVEDAKKIKAGEYNDNPRMYETTLWNIDWKTNYWDYYMFQWVVSTGLLGGYAEIADAFNRIVKLFNKYGNNVIFTKDDINISNSTKRIYELCGRPNGEWEEIKDENGNFDVKFNEIRYPYRLEDMAEMKNTMQNFSPFRDFLEDFDRLIEIGRLILEDDLITRYFCNPDAHIETNNNFIYGFIPTKESVHMDFTGMSLQEKYDTMVDNLLYKDYTLPLFNFFFIRLEKEYNHDIAIRKQNPFNIRPIYIASEPIKEVLKFEPSPDGTVVKHSGRAMTLDGEKIYEFDFVDRYPVGEYPFDKPNYDFEGLDHKWEEMNNGVRPDPAINFPLMHP